MATFSKTFETEKSSFFLHPKNVIPGKSRSVLAFLRLDLQELYGGEDDPYGTLDDSDLRAPLLAALGVMIGFELLSRVYSGKHKSWHKGIKKGVAHNFNDLEEFLHKVAGLTDVEAVTLTQFRHAAVHGYRLQATHPDTADKYSFGVVSDTAKSWRVLNPGSGSGHFIVNLWRLKELFLSTIAKFQRLLDADPALQFIFVPTVHNIGNIGFTDV